MVSRYWRGPLCGKPEGVNFDMCCVSFSYKRIGPPRGFKQHKGTLLRSHGRVGALGYCAAACMSSLHGEWL